MVEQVAPFTGAWIEIDRMSSCPFAVVVAPFTGAWIEIMKYDVTYSCGHTSHPSRVRGLKYGRAKIGRVQAPSHPSRVRGLKYFAFASLRLLSAVAPFTGAWIEIISPYARDSR